ncbi:hypothetical protein DFO67_11537 [Modicisalibacter xianhensis]|uniref:Uncharacterized protein n=1 Tax=Modicisalibacter xianhensis TaxID=442341 RepID=A0A4R8FMY3_9GAMM|nr:hypothetical protein [Halomonas xianhensis]TDX26772.1 hypothetical protein DFO67_11537 [Halomonas xianhensis]
MNTITQQERAVIEALRSRGFCLAMWHPDELRGQCPVDMQQVAVNAVAEHFHSISGGSDIDLDDLSGCSVYELALPGYDGTDATLNQLLWVILDDEEAEGVRDRCTWIKNAFGVVHEPDLDNNSIDYDAREPGALDHLLSMLEGFEETVAA